LQVASYKFLFPHLFTKGGKGGCFWFTLYKLYELFNSMNSTDSMHSTHSTHSIKIARSPEIYSKCWNYLNNYGTPALKGTVLFYIDDDAGNIKACAGWTPDFGGAIEPMQSEGAVWTHALGFFMMGFITGKGYAHISCWTTNEKWKAILQKIGFHIWSGTGCKLTQLVKEI
jgi:hypothetical protein